MNPVFLFTEIRSNGLYAVKRVCDSWKHAQQVADENDWLLDGRLMFTLDNITDERADIIIQALTERDENVLH